MAERGGTHTRRRVRRRDQWDGSALANYGEIDNLLECVSSYTHEVASLNAANVWAMRVGVDDFTIVGTTIAHDVPADVRSEMVGFFERELQTPSWMRALSPWDPDASYSVRPDHQWNGAYPAWPADAAPLARRALGTAGGRRPDRGPRSLGEPGAAGAGALRRRGAAPLNGGARKAPAQRPYILDWACSSAGAWVAMVIESFFGVEPRLDATLAVDGCMQLIDPKAKLCNLRIGGRLVDVHADGTVVEVS